MKEQLLQFIWKNQLLTPDALVSKAGEKITLLNPGTLNTEAGPDFLNAQVEINNILWSGHIEIHVKAADWYLHAHHRDGNYDSVILHIVWQDNGGPNLPTIELKGHINRSLLHSYQVLMESISDIPCESMLTKIPESKVSEMLNRMIQERLLHRSKSILNLHNLLDSNWQFVFLAVLCRYFGFKANEKGFTLLSERLPYQILMKYTALEDFEAFLFGMAGLLKNPVDSYSRQMAGQWIYLKRKHGLKEIPLIKWNYMRSRPSNFPDIRLAQFSALLCTGINFYKLLNVNDLKAIRTDLTVDPASYWDTHVRLGKESIRNKRAIGIASINQLIINGFIPVLFAYGKWKNEQRIMDRAYSLVAQLPPENNKITRIFHRLGLKNTSALDTQAQIELYKSYCCLKKCLSCTLGTHILKTPVSNVSKTE